MNYYTGVLKKYAVFSGRAPRKEYWYFILFNTLAYFVLAFIDDSGVLVGIYALSVVVPSFAVGIRRLHDIGKSGWRLLIALIPLIGSIILIIYLVRDSQPGENQYGPSPKESKEITISENKVATQNYCHSCGSKIDLDSKFCTHCGNKINKA